MYLSPSWKPNSPSATENFHNILWHSKFHYGVQKSSPLVPVLSQMNTVLTLQPFPLKPTFILSSNLFVGLPNGLFILRAKEQKLVLLHFTQKHINRLAFSTKYWYFNITLPYFKRCARFEACSRDTHEGPLR